MKYYKVHTQQCDDECGGGPRFYFAVIIGDKGISIASNYGETRYKAIRNATLNAIADNKNFLAEYKLAENRSR